MDEASYLRYLRMAGAAASGADRGMTLPVRLKLIDEDAYTHEGKSYEYIAWQGSVVIGNSGEARLSIPFHGGTKIHLGGFTKDSVRYVVAPRIITFEPGTRVRLTAQIKPD